MIKLKQAFWVGNVKNLSLVHSGLLVMISFIACISFYIAYQINVYKEVKIALKIDVQGFLDAYRLSGDISFIHNIITQRINNPEINSFYLLIDQDGSPINGNLKSLPTVIEGRENEFTLYEVHYNDVVPASSTQQQRGSHPYYDIMAITTELKNGMQLIIGRDVDEFQIFREMLIVLGGGTAILLIITACVGFLMSALIIKHIRLINTAADEIIKTGDISNRIPVQHMRGEFRGLADILNSMLDQIQHLVAGIKQVSDNIAHDLRTPLTRLKHNIEDLERDNSDSRIRQIADETDRIINTFNALLRIANVEQSKLTKTFQNVDLTTILKDLYEYYILIAEDKDIVFELKTTDSITNIKGDKDLLFQAFSNIIENSLKFTPKGGAVHLTVESEAPIIKIEVIDNGPGIPEADMPFVFQRFYRVDKSRHIRGNGLGLSLVKAIMNLHSASIKLKTNQPHGLKTIIRFNLE
ncbi:MAG: HAMP domain-containing histidine kinase [Desulfobacterales bacterium]|nr:HAMP domain-containing histidine kinase [Desulfobacterales bacterium]